MVLLQFKAVVPEFVVVVECFVQVVAEQGCCFLLLMLELTAVVPEIVVVKQETTRW